MHEHHARSPQSIEEIDGVVAAAPALEEPGLALVAHLAQRPPESRASVLMSVSRTAGNRAVCRTIGALKPRIVTPNAMKVWTDLAGQVNEYAVLRDKIKGYGHLFEADHLIEDRFWKVLPGGTHPANWPATLVPRNQAVAAQLKGYAGYVHTEKTARLRKLIPHGKEHLYSPQQVWDAHAKVLGELGTGQGLDLVHDAGDLFDGAGVNLRTTFPGDHFDADKWVPERLDPKTPPVKATLPKDTVHKGAAKGTAKVTAKGRAAQGAKVASHAKFAVGLVLDAALLSVDLILSSLADRLEEANNEALQQSWKLTVLPKFEARMQEELSNALLLVNPEPRWITVRWRSVMEVQDRELADVAVAILRLISLQGTFVEIFDHIEVEDVFVSPTGRNEPLTARNGSSGRMRHYVFETSVLISDPTVSKQWLLEDTGRTYARNQWGKILVRLDDPEDPVWSVGIPLMTRDYTGAAEALGKLLEQPLDAALRDDILEFRAWLQQHAEEQATGRAALDEHQRDLLEILETALPELAAQQPSAWP